jgi:hypothetical protein
MVILNVLLGCPAGKGLNTFIPVFIWNAEYQARDSNEKFLIKIFRFPDFFRFLD